MASQLQYRSSPVTPQRGGASFPDDVSDSGYGGSLSDCSSTDCHGLMEGSRSSDSLSRHLHIPTDRQQELYSENCRLLSTSIEDTKEILKVLGCLMTYVVLTL